MARPAGNRDAAVTRRTLMVKPELYDRLAKVAETLDLTIIAAGEIVLTQFADVDHIRPHVDAFRAAQAKPKIDDMLKKIGSLSNAERDALIAQLQEQQAQKEEQGRQD